jgi:alkaline phosphatase D
MDRRSFLRNSGFLTVSVAMGGLAGCGSSGSLPAQAMGSGWKFPQSVGSGDPRRKGPYQDPGGSADGG